MRACQVVCDKSESVVDVCVHSTIMVASEQNVYHQDKTTKVKSKQRNKIKKKTFKALFINFPKAWIRWRIRDDFKKKELRS